MPSRDGLITYDGNDNSARATGFDTPLKGDSVVNDEVGCFSYLTKMHQLPSTTSFAFGIFKLHLQGLFPDNLAV